jgi:hypothetical protein
MIVFGLIFWESRTGPGRFAPRSARCDGLSLSADDDRAARWNPQCLGLPVRLAHELDRVQSRPTRCRSRSAKALMGIESFVSAVTVLLVAARAVNVLGS